jgi:hypothetical protein
MKYLCLIYEEEPRLEALPPAEYDALVAEILGYVDGLRARGQLLAGEPLKSVRSATSVRVRDGKASMTDGPFAETKEALGGFILVDVPDLDAALAIAANWPSARFGGVEVRPVAELMTPNPH